MYNIYNIYIIYKYIYIYISDFALVADGHVF